MRHPELIKNLLKKTTYLTLLTCLILIYSHSIPALAEESSNAIHYKDKGIIAESPVEARLNKPIIVKNKNFPEYNILIISSYEAKARSLAKKKYENDLFSKISNYDFAIGWQEMSNPKLLQSANITQEDRKSYVDIDFNSNSINSIDSIFSHYSNEHIVASNIQIAKKLQKVNPGELIHIKGQILHVELSGQPIKLDNLKDDSCQSACKMILIKDIQIIKSKNISAHHYSNEKQTVARY